VKAYTKTPYYEGRKGSMVNGGVQCQMVVNTGKKSKTQQGQCATMITYSFTYLFETFVGLQENWEVENMHTPIIYVRK
jgi:hypothetical protein